MIDICRVHIFHFTCPSIHDLFSEFEKKKNENFVVFCDFFLPFLEIKLIKLVTSRPRHVLGRF
jgi:hypothetical protein